MRTLVLAAAALLCGTAAYAQTPTTTADGNQTVQGATTKVIAMGDQYTVHRVMPDGTVMVKTLTGKDAKLAMKGETPPALAAFMATGASSTMTMGAGETTQTTTETTTQPKQ